MLAPRPSVSSLTRAAISSDEESITATGALACPAYGSGLRTTPMTRAPRQVAIWVAACPTLPLTPMMSTVSPRFGMPERRKPSMAATNGTPMPAASIERDIGWLFDECVGLDHQMRGVCAVTPNAEIAGRALGFKSLLIITTRLLICKPGLGEYKGRPAAMPSRVFRLRREGRHCLVAGVLAFFARRDEWVPLRCVAFHKWIFLGRFSTIEAFFKTFKCRRAAIKRHPQCGALGAHLKAICRSKP